MPLTLHLANSPLGAVDSLETMIETGRVRWVAAITIAAPTPALAEAAMAALQARVGETGDLALKAGEATIRALPAADCRDGPRLAHVRADAPMPEAAHGPRRAKLTLEAVPQDSAVAVQSHSFSVHSLRAAGASPRLRTRGQIVLRAGEDPASHEGLIAAPAPGFRRLRSAVTRDAAGPTLDYETEDEQTFVPLPAGVDDGHVIRTLHTLPDGRRVQTTGGFFAGPGALARALELQPPGGEARVAHNPHTRRVDFEFRESLADAPGLLARGESISYVTTRRVLDHPQLHGPAWRQQVGAPYTEITQEGSAAGASRHPAPPPALYPADLLERRVQYSFPDAALPPERRYVTQWRYAMRARLEIQPQTPEAR